MNKIGRRDFLGLVAGTGAALFLERYSEAEAAIAEMCKESKIVIDEHRHIGYACSRPARSAEDIVAELDRLGVDHAIIVAGEKKPTTREEELAEEADSYAVVEQFIETGKLTPEIETFHSHVYDQSLVLEAVRAHKGRLSGGYILNPWIPTEFDKARQAVKEHKFRYLKFCPWSHAFAADDKKVLGPAVELALELSVPLWFHTSYGPGTEPQRISRLAEEFPKARMIMGHCCVAENNASIVAEVMKSRKNVWADFALSTEEAMRTVVAEADEYGDRLMLASDDPWGFPSFSLQGQMDRLKRVTEGKPDLRCRIMGENASHLLRIGR